MTRILAAVLMFLLLLALQVSFIQSLSAPFSVTPVLFVSMAFLYQYVGVRAAVWGVMLEGVFLDVLLIGAAPWETAAYAAGAVTLVCTSDHLFSNRSYYGLASVTLLSLCAITAVEIGMGAVVGGMGSGALDLWTVLQVRTTGMALSLPLLLILFPLARPIRSLIHLLLPL